MATQQMQQKTGASNLEYDIVAEMHELLEGNAALEQYINDARQAGDRDAEQCFQQIQDQNRKSVATPGYFERHGVPHSPEELASHNCLTYTHFNPQETWRLRGPGGDIAVPISGNLRLNDDEALSAAVLGGLGVALLPTFIIGRDLQAGRLTAVLSDYVPSERHIHAVYLPNRHLPAKVRAFIDFLVERFSPRPYWDVE